MALNSVASWLMRSSESLNDKLDLSRSDSTEAHVLAVDDSLVDLKVIEKLLKTSSCKVTAVDSGIRALEFLGLNAEKSPANFDSLKVDLIITDYCMPGMNGYELLKKIKESSVFREIPVVIMSSENVVARIKRCLEEGAEAFLMKPVKPSDVKLLKDYMTKDSSGKADATTTAAGDRDSYSNLKRKLRESSSDDQFPSPPSTSPSSSPAPSLSSSPSQSMGSSSSSSPDSSSPLESPTRRLGMTNSY